MLTLYNPNLDTPNRHRNDVVRPAPMLHGLGETAEMATTRNYFAALTNLVLEETTSSEEEEEPIRCDLPSKQ